MEIFTAVILQVALLTLALSITALRCFVRVKIENRTLTLADYLVWVGWLFAVGWTVSQCRSLYILVDHPLVDDTYSDSEDYLKTVFVSGPLFDVGLYFPKASMITFYWAIVPFGFKGLRIGLYVNTAFVAAAALVCIIGDLSIAHPISKNWSLKHEDQDQSLWNSYSSFVINWTLNFATDIARFSSLTVFIFPFFMLKSLKLRQRQTIGLIGVFSLGLLTMIMSLARFTAYIVSDFDLSDANGAVWCTAEICTALIVASLPGLKALITRKLKGASGLGSSSYGRATQPSQLQSQSRLARFSAKMGRMTLRDDESAIELASVDPSIADEKVKTRITVTSDVSVERGDSLGELVRNNGINVPL